ncbi:MAG TPA: CRTAC1 family protein [Myxococcota bacterium]|nr:CRTAC1 family protein [Myxococcota bacterium]
MRYEIRFIVSAAFGLACLAGCQAEEAAKCSPPDPANAPPGSACAADTECAATGGQAGMCVMGICGIAPAVGECQEDGSLISCPLGLSCRILTVYQGEKSACLPSCDCGLCAGSCDQTGCLPAKDDNCDPRSCSIHRYPDLINKQPPPLGAGPYFTDVTEEANLAASGEDVCGNRIALADIDEDGFDDLFVHSTKNTIRDDLTAQPPLRYKRVLLNRPGPAGGRVFEEHTDASGYTATRDGVGGRSASFAVFADVNNDGHLDIFSGSFVDGNTSVTDPGDRSEILLGQGDGTFELAPASDTTPGQDERLSTTSAAFLDYDRDGRVDLFVGFWYRIYGYLTALQDRLYQGGGDGLFTDVTEAAGLKTNDAGFDLGVNHRPTYGVTVCDVDSDGDDDILASAYGRQPNMLWQNDGDGQFENIAYRVGFAADNILEYDDNQFFRCHCQLVPNDPQCDPSPGTPAIQCSSDYWNSSIDNKPWRLGGNTFTTVCGDIDADGDMDLFNAEIRHWHIGQSADPSQLLLNEQDGQGGWHFSRPGNAAMGLEREWSSPDWNEGDITAAFLDFDADGALDIFLGCSDYPGDHDFLFRQLGDHTFEDVSQASGAAHYYGNGVAVDDYDRDGDLDIAVGSSTMRCSSDPDCPWTRNEVHLYRNDVGQDSNWMAIRLVGAGDGASNVSSIGARVVVSAGGASQQREVQGGYGHFGLQGGLRVYFGLGDECLAKEVKIFWPDKAGSVSIYKYVPANYFITIYESDGRIEYSAP